MCGFPPFRLKENFPVNDPQQGWNGKLEGKDIVPGVYTWIAIIRTKDGTVKMHTGDVTVVR